MAKDDLYISVDIETDGPIPGPNSMLSLGAAAFRAGSREPVATFEINLTPLPGATPDPETMTWWSKQDPEVWKHVTSNPVEPRVAMQAFVDWVRGLGGDPVMVVYPSWDDMWVSWYVVRFCGKNPFGLGCLDIKSMAFGVLPDFDKYKSVSKRNFPKDLFEGCPPHTHKALDDALGQGVLFINLLSRRNF
jgi:hypothetical protein